MAVVQSFQAAIRCQAKVLVLGSMPGIASLNADQYYAHPRNAFWPIMASYFNFDAQLPYINRLSLLQQKGVGLWDVMAQCERSGSLDSAISSASIEVNPLAELLAAQPSIECVLLNGGKAYQQFAKHFKGLLNQQGLVVSQMPSTSPAYAAMSFAEKQRRWHQALDVVFNS